MLPLGGPKAQGYGLSFAVETLAAVLPGLGFGVDPKGRHNDGTFMLVVDPLAFSPTTSNPVEPSAIPQATPPADRLRRSLYQARSRSGSTTSMNVIVVAPFRSTPKPRAWEHCGQGLYRKGQP